LKKIWGPLRKLFATPGVPCWLRTWAKPSDGLAFLTNNRDVILILKCFRRVVQKETQTEFYLLIVLAGILQSQNLSIGIL